MSKAPTNKKSSFAGPIYIQINGTNKVRSNYQTINLEMMHCQETSRTSDFQFQAILDIINYCLEACKHLNIYEAYVD